MAKSTVRVRRHWRRIRRQALIRDGFTIGEAEFYTFFNWKLADGPFPELRRIRKAEVAELKKRGRSESEIVSFFEDQWAMTNEADLTRQLIDEKYISLK